jgi:hypothetical protein
MREKLNIILLILLISCNSKTSNKSIKKDKIPASVTKNNFEYDTGNIQADTLLINKQQYIRILRDNKFNCLLSRKGDTIVKSEDYYFKVDFLDIDEDGYKDIRIFTFSNTPNQCDNYLFDRKLKTFKLIENCGLDIQKIKGTQFYYSYNRAGCADLNWESHLSKIENYELVNYGYIIGHGCDFEVKKNVQSIDIYKIIDSKKYEKKLIKSLPYLKHIPKNDDKWDFIEKYWKKNIKVFD